MTQDAIDDPLKVSDIQETIEEEILPAIDYSLERLRIVEGDPDFTFELTPEMQGDEEEEPREIDLGEAYLIDAGLRLTKAVFLVATAYDFDFDDNGSYAFLDSGSNENVLRHMERLDKTGTFMTLRSADAMPGAKASILTAIDKIEQGMERSGPRPTIRRMTLSWPMIWTTWTRRSTCRIRTTCPRSSATSAQSGTL